MYYKMVYDDDREREQFIVTSLRGILYSHWCIYTQPVKNTTVLMKHVFGKMWNDSQYLVTIPEKAIMYSIKTSVAPEMRCVLCESRKLKTQNAIRIELLPRYSW